jgi:asparagine synthase (glutamine-hydrolysing)
MPGIVGLVTRMPRAQAEAELRRMVEALCHESFYETGSWINESLGVYVGWVARKNSVSDGMPLRNERGDNILVFSGEEFPEAGINRCLQERGHILSDQPASYLVHLYEEEPSFPACLNGRFHGLVADETQGTATLFNDRYGMHRVYYHESPEAFYFAAEAKAILEVRPELRSLDPGALGEFVAYGCVLENRTLFRGISVLPPASVWVFQRDSLSRKSYFDPAEWEGQTALEPEAYYQELRRVFAANLPRYFSGRERIAVSLTGGLDTRMVMAWEKSAPGTLPCYSFGGAFRESQDVVIARQVAKSCEQPHQVIKVGDEFLNRFSRYAERTVYLTDGCADVSRSADLYVNERAREVAPVRMTGNYGGEVLRRVRAFKPAPATAGLFSGDFLPQVQAANAIYARVVEGHPLSFAVFRQAPWHHYGLLELEQTQISTRSPFLDNDFVRTVFRAPDSACASNDVCLRLIADGDAKLSRIRTDRGLAGSQGLLPGALLGGFLEFTFKSEYAYDYGMPQWIAKIDHRLSRLHLERLFLGRHKFYHYRVWYRDVLSNYVREMLLDPRTLSRPYLQPKKLELMVRGHLRGDWNYTSEIHKVLTLELLHRLFVDAR